MAKQVVPADSVTFDVLCIALEKLHKKKKQRPEQDKILANFIDELKLNAAKFDGKEKNSTLFPIMRLLLPNLERERSAYNLKETKLGALLVKVLSLNKQSPDAQKLLNFRSVSNAQDSDFPGVAYFVLKNRIGNKTATLSIGEINEILDKISTAEVGNKGQTLDDIFSYVIRRLSADQLKWFLRIILKDLKIGLGTHRTLAALHPDAPEYYDNCKTLSKVCEECEEGDTRPLELGVQLFNAVSPMLSERLNIVDISKLSLDKIYHIEEKFDGERFQIHMENGVFEYFSRKGYTYSSNYGKTYDSGLLTPSLKDCFSASVTSFIMDGEMMGWNKYDQCLSSKGMAFDVKKITDKSKFSPCFCAFDLLYYNGKSLVGPADKGGLLLTERLKLLDTMFTDVTGVIQHSSRRLVNDNSDILNALNKAIESQEEGIVVKEIESYYIANRRNAGWYKIKPEYTEDSMSDLDLVIIGADEAENKRQGRAKSFLIACADKVTPDDPPHRWICVGRVSTGFTFEERERVCKALEKHWSHYKRKAPPSSLVFNREKPDFWLLPEHSIVLQVRATELIRSTSFGAAYTLRFPRVVRIRDDKPVQDIMTLDELNRLVANKGPVVKLSTKRINESQIGEVRMKTRRKRAAVPQVAEPFKINTEKDVPVISKALFGREIAILSEDTDCTKQELIKIVESHGGKVVANVGSKTWCCVAGRLTYRVRSVLELREVDVVSASWVRSLPASQTPCSFSPLDMLATTTATQLALARKYDSFGDSYLENLDEETLKKCFRKMDDNEPEVYLSNQEILNLEAEIFKDQNPYSFLRPCFLYFVKKNSLNAIRAKMFGATLCDIEADRWTHMIVPKNMSSDETNNIMQRAGLRIVVSEDWLEQCFIERKLVPEHNFMFANKK